MQLDPAIADAVTEVQLGFQRAVRTKLLPELRGITPRVNVPSSSPYLASSESLSANEAEGMLSMCVPRTIYEDVYTSQNTSGQPNPPRSPYAGQGIPGVGTGYPAPPPPPSSPAYAMQQGNGTGSGYGSRHQPAPGSRQVSNSMQFSMGLDLYDACSPSYQEAHVISPLQSPLSRAQSNAMDMAPGRQQQAQPQQRAGLGPISGPSRTVSGKVGALGGSSSNYQVAASLLEGPSSTASLLAPLSPHSNSRSLFVQGSGRYTGDLDDVTRLLETSQQDAGIVIQGLGNPRQLATSPTAAAGITSHLLSTSPLSSGNLFGTSPTYGSSELARLSSGGLGLGLGSNSMAGNGGLAGGGGAGGLGYNLGTSPSPAASPLATSPLATAGNSGTVGFNRFGSIGSNRCPGPPSRTTSQNLAAAAAAAANAAAAVAAAPGVLGAALGNATVFGSFGAGSTAGSDRQSLGRSVSGFGNNNHHHHPVSPSVGASGAGAGAPTGDVGEFSVPMVPHNFIDGAVCFAPGPVFNVAHSPAKPTDQDNSGELLIGKGRRRAVSQLVACMC